MGWESNLAPAPLAGCQSLVSRAAASTSNRQSQGRSCAHCHKGPPFPQMDWVPALEYGPVTCPSLCVAFLSKLQALAVGDDQSNPLRDWSSNSIHLVHFESFSSLSPWRHQVSVMGQNLSFYRELICKAMLNRDVQYFLLTSMREWLVVSWYKGVDSFRVRK